MRKTNKKLTLKTNTVRSLDASSLGDAAGGWTIPTEASWCTPTFAYGCVPKTPNCPR
jgi:hypothetical protein